jgi:carboxymethylenebutenolidase
MHLSARSVRFFSPPGTTGPRQRLHGGGAHAIIRSVSEVTIAAPGGPLPGYLASPEAAPPVPGVVVVHEAFGLTDEMRAHADRIAGAGFLALAPDLYSWATKARCVAATMIAVSRGHGRVFDDIEAARAWLAGHEDSTGAVGIVGFCMGGGLALACAPRGGYGAAASNYGEVPSNAERALEGICPVVASYGSRDRYLRGHANRLRGALDTLGVAHDVKEYEGNTHGFMNPHPGVLPKITGMLLPLEFDEAAADDAWSRIFTFFDRHLRAPAS